jgi:hypothetical protein
MAELIDVSNNIISNNGDGIQIWDSYLSTISGNTIMSSSNYGIYLDGYSGLNTIYHNNIIDNTVQVYDSNPEDNDWHHQELLEGNYWSDYTGLDDGSNSRTAEDGIGDTKIPHPDTDQGNGYYQLDNYPLMLPSYHTPVGEDVDVNLNVGVNVGFEVVTEEGVTSVEISTENPGDDPSGFEFLGTYYDITTTATYDGDITICIEYEDANDDGYVDGTDPPVHENDLEIMYWDSTIPDWVPVVNAEVKATENKICFTVNHLTWFGIGYINKSPVADANGPYEINEGSEITLDASGSYDPYNDPLQYYWDIDNDSEYDDETGETPTVGWSTLLSLGLGDDGSYPIGLEVSDGELTDTDTATVKIFNVAPTITLIEGPMEPVNINNPVEMKGTFTDPGTLDTHTAIWYWGDGDSSAGIVIESEGSGIVIGSHIYNEPGVYEITLTVADDDEDSHSLVYSQYIVVYDPSAGFVTGGGWIISPVGAYQPDTSLTGKASFGFVSKYKKGATVPDGNTQFQFKVADLNFHSTSYDWLVVSNDKAKYKGTGTINGEGEYKFMISAIDDDEGDQFRIKIWWEETVEEVLIEHVIYDNGEDTDGDETLTTLSGGSIVIHTSKK